MMKAIKQLENGKAAGLDKIPTTLVQDATEFISLIMINDDFQYIIEFRCLPR